MTAIDEIRKRYIEFFSARGHTVIPSAPLVPENDPTTLFTGSGMQPLVPYLLGQPHPEGKRLVNAQKCFRAEDIDEVGDNRHTTFFEMLGNWSLGDYFKAEQLAWIFEFLTNKEKGAGLDPKNLYITVFAGDEEMDIPRDEESVLIWKRLFKEKGIDAAYVELGSEEEGSRKGMQGGRIFSYGVKKNWWSRSGVPANMPAGEPGGPDSEIFYDFGPLTNTGQIRHTAEFGKECHPNCNCGRFLEIGNSVFMEYKKRKDGAFEKMKQRNVDFGGGLERITMAANDAVDIFLVNHKAIIDELERVSGKKYTEDPHSFRIIADHMKAAVFLIADGMSPTKGDRGYFVRRLIRRSVRYADKLGIGENGFSLITNPIVGMYGDVYPELGERRKEIQAVISGEEKRFRETLARGIAIIRNYYAKGSFGTGGRSPAGEDLETRNMINGETLFDLYTTHGFPVELSLEEFDELKKEHPDDPSLQYERERVLADFQNRLAKHQEISRAGADQKFKGGLADHSEKTVRLHTAHHLLLKALQIVLRSPVKQRGSNITNERLRMDFSFNRKLTDEEKKEAERIVNEKIAEDLPVIRTEMTREEAETLGAEREFGQKYPDRVSVYSVGPKDATPETPHFSRAFSVEFCGGPHVGHTGEIGKFRITKEEASAAGVRRIKATVE